MLAENDSEQTDCSADALWPTPSACNANDGEGAKTWLARRERLKAKGYNGNGAGIPLAIAVQAPAELAPASSTSSSAACLVSRLRQLVGAVATGTSGGSGAKLCALSVTSDRAGPYWSSLQASLAFDTETGSRPLDEYSSSWPRWGTVAAGECGQPQMWALRTDGTESSSSSDDWKTPRAAMASMYAEDAETFDGRGKQTRETLARQAAHAEMWPTPTADDSKNARNATAQRTGGSRHHSGTTRVDATTPQENWATPRASCHDMDTLERSRYAGSRLKEMKQAGQPYVTKTSGMLNPAWVSQMMGFPVGWLDIPGPPALAGRSTPVKRRVSRTACRKE